MSSARTVILAVWALVVVLLTVAIATGSQPDAQDVTLRFCEGTVGAGFATTDSFGSVTADGTAPIAYTIEPSAIEGHELDHAYFAISDAGVVSPSALGADNITGLQGGVYAFTVRAVDATGRDDIFRVVAQACVLPTPTPTAEPQ